MSMLVVRFYVGTKEEDAILKVYNKLYSNFDRIPQGVSQPLIKVRSIDDVPIMALTLWGKHYDSYQLRQIAGELEHQLKQIDDVSETKIIGGLPRQVRVVLDTQRLAAYGMTAGRRDCATAASQLHAAHPEALPRTTRSFEVEAGRFLGSAEDLKQVVVGVSQGKPVYLRDVAAEIVDGPAEPDDYVLYANAAGAPKGAVARRLSCGNDHAGQAQRHQRDGDQRSSRKENRRSARIPAALRPECHGHAQLWRDGEGQVRRTAEASASWLRCRSRC